MNPLVSIILPTYKNADRIASAIESVKNQLYTNWEMTIIDDGLYDQSKLAIDALIQNDSRIVLLGNRKNSGIQKALNDGIAYAKGKYIARIDDDDIWIDINKLAQQVKFLESNPEYVLLGTSAIICDEKGIELARYKLPESDEDIRKRILSRNCFLHPTVLIRKDAIDQVGGYSEESTVKHLEDYDLWLRLGTIGKFANLPIFGARLTIHSTSLTYKNRLNQAVRTLVLARKYRKYYTNFYYGQLILLVRVMGFTVLRYIPIPRSVLYGIQKWYKKI